MRKFIFTAILITLFFSCAKENEIISEDVDGWIPEEVLSNSVLLENYNIPEDDIYYLQELGFSGSPIAVYNNTSETDYDFISYVIEGDIEIRK